MTYLNYEISISDHDALIAYLAKDKRRWYRISQKPIPKVGVSARQSISFRRAMHILDKINNE